MKSMHCLSILYSKMKGWRRRKCCGTMSKYRSWQVAFRLNIENLKCECTNPNELQSLELALQLQAEELSRVRIVTEDGYNEDELSVRRTTSVDFDGDAVHRRGELLFVPGETREGRECDRVEVRTRVP
eukprot:TRINITY_DN8671_c0_g2_i2.p2 TRINITY_DN8671_c0_g2~~TRINITY_DN8671_c0_g2_i2.p2  ORF type:complete len:128 (+),score=18.20 TRINITY_DN8671_c0_g2_i2:94-477(+)